MFRRSSGKEKKYREAEVVVDLRKARNSRHKIGEAKEGGLALYLRRSVKWGILGKRGKLRKLAAHRDKWDEGLGVNAILSLEPPNRIRVFRC